jgi:hypothetical protein
VNLITAKALGLNVSRQQYSPVPTR